MSKPKKYLCEECTKYFWSERGAQMHRRLKHSTPAKAQPAEPEWFTNAPNEHVFHVADGSTLKNVWDLLGKLAIMEDWVFQHHVNEQRNDFANWFHDIFGHEELAGRMRSCSDRKDMQIVLLKEIVATVRK